MRDLRAKSPADLFPSRFALRTLDTYTAYAPDRHRTKEPRMMPLAHLTPHTQRPTLAALPANVTPLPTSPTTPIAA